MCSDLLSQCCKLQIDIESVLLCCVSRQNKSDLFRRLISELGSSNYERIHFTTYFLTAIQESAFDETEGNRIYPRSIGL